MDRLRLVDQRFATEDDDEGASDAADAKRNDLHAALSLVRRGRLAPGTGRTVAQLRAPSKTG